MSNEKLPFSFYVGELSLFGMVMNRSKENEPNPSNVMGQNIDWNQSFLFKSLIISIWQVCGPYLLSWHLVSKKIIQICMRSTYLDFI